MFNAMDLYCRKNGVSFPFVNTQLKIRKLLLLLLSPLYRVFTRMSLRQTMSLGDTLLQLLFRFIVSTVYGAYLPRSYVGSDGLLRLLLLLLLYL